MVGQSAGCLPGSLTAPRPRCAQFYNQIYNRTYGPFNRGSSLPAGANALNYTSPVLSSAIIPVAPNTQYFYQVSDSAGVCTGIVYNFWSAPGAHPHPQPIMLTLPGQQRRRRLHRHRLQILERA